MFEGGENLRFLLHFFKSIEKPVEDVAREGRDEKNMCVRDAAAARVLADEIRFERLHKYQGGAARDIVKAGCFLRRQVVPPRNVAFRDHEAMSAGERVDVKKRHTQIVFEDDMGRCPSLRDIAEDTFIQLVFLIFHCASPL